MWRGFFVVVAAHLSLSFMPPAESAPCSASTVTMNVGSASDLQDMANTLNCTGKGVFKVNWTGSLQLGRRIELSDGKNLTVTGSDTLLTGVASDGIDGGNTTGMFAVSGGSTLIIQNLVLEGGYAENGGSVDVRSFSSVYVNGCSFTNNVASTGGAIFADFSEIYVDGDTSFEKNKATGRGGAIAANQSEIYIAGQSYFAHNVAHQDGGAIYVDESTIHVDGNTSFVNNSATVDAGVIHATNSDIGVNGSTSFAKNSAGNDGGVLYLNNGSTYFDGITTFGYNSVENEGGVIFAEQGSEIRVDGHTSFTNNFCRESGAASELHIDGHTSFTDNVALHAGGTHRTDRQVYLCQTNGGAWKLVHMNCAIYTGTSGVYIAGETYFAYNSAGFDGGAIFTHGNSQVHVTGYTSFGNNSAANSGGALYTTGSTWHVDGNTSFTGNTAGANGGAISAPDTCTIFIGGFTSFLSNVASWRGESWSFSSNTINGTGSTMSSLLPVGKDKGAVYIARSELETSGVTSVIDNKAYDGGAFGVRQSSIQIDGNTTFSRNSATHNGGAINMLGSNATIKGPAEISGNTALNGGGIFSALSPKFHVLGMVNFEENAVVLDGGAISLTDPTVFDIHGTSFVSNEAVFGGAVSMTSTTKTTGSLEFCRFDGNDASNGGALYLSTGGTGETERSTLVQDSIFLHNVAHESGGALFNIGPLTIIDAVFEGNTAAAGGLAIANAEPLPDMGNVTFHGNLLSCSPGEYSDFDQGYSGGCRLQLVCEECFDRCQVDRSIANVTSDAIPSCRAIPVGVSQSATTTLATFNLMAGYYRVSADSRDVLECYRNESCTGGDNARNYCATGYTGPYCAVCAGGYSQAMLNRCHKCSVEHRGLAMGLATGVLVLAILMAVLLVPRLLRKSNGEGQVRCWDTISSSYTFALKALPLSAIKIVVVVLQITTQFTEIAGEVYPDVYEAFLSKLTAINLDIGFILSNLCIMKTDFYDRLLLATVGPPVVLFVLSATSFIMRRKGRNTVMAGLIAKRKDLATGLFILFFVYASVSFTIFQTFVCEDLDDGNAYLRADYSVTCWKEKHAKYGMYAIVMVFVYPIGVPVLFAAWLVHNRQDLENPDRQAMAHLQSFRGLWSAYKPSCYYYEVVECIRRVGLTGAAVFVLPNTADQIALVLLVAVMFMFISESLSPFENNHDMWLYRWGNAIILVSMYVALLLKVDLAGEESGISMAMTAVLIMANVVMISIVVVQAVLLMKGIYISRRIEGVYDTSSSFVWES